MSMAAEREANEQNSIEHERLPTEEDIEQIINPIYQQEVLAKESLLLERIAHDVWGWRKNKKLPLTGLVKSAVGATPTALLRGVSQRFDENNHVADLLVRHKILSECGDGTTVRELTECADRVVKDGARKRMCLWQLSLLDIAEKQLGIKENRPSRAFGQQRFEEFQPQQGSEKTITHHNLERCIKHLSDRTQEIAAAGEDGQRLAEFQKEKPEAFELFQELERRYGSSPERVEKRLKELDPVEPERFWVDGYSTTRRAKTHLSELLCQKLHKAITQNQKWSDKARDMGETCHAYYEELQDHFKKIGYQPKNDPEYQRVHDQIAQRREHCLKNNLAQSKDEKLQHLLQKQQNLVEAITNAKPDRYPNYKEMKQQMREQLEKWTRETILNEREATNRSTPEGREAIEMLLKETKTVLEGGSSRSGIYRGKRLEYDEGSKQLWRAHLKNFDRSIEAIFPKEGPFSTAHVKDELQKMNEVSVQAIGQNRIPKRLMQPPESKDVQEVINRQFWGGVGKRIATLDRQTFATILQEALDKGNDDYYTAHELDNEAPEELKGGIQIRPQFEKMAMELCKRTNPTVVQEILTQNLNYAETALETARPLNEINRMNNVFDTVLTKDGRIHTTIYRVGGRGLLQGKPIHYTSRPAAETIGKDIELDDIELTRENREREAEARTR